MMELKNIYKSINLANDIKDAVDFYENTNDENALKMAEKLLGDFPTIYKVVSGKDFLRPIKGVIAEIKEREFKQYEELRDKLGKDIADRNLLGNDQERIIMMNYIDIKKN